MKLLKIVGIAALALVALVVVVSFFLPKTYHVERTVSIAAPASQVHRLTSDLAKGWPQWEPWSEVDDTIQTTYGDVTSGVGASQIWTGTSGSGELTLTHCDENTGVEYDMSFDEGEYPSTGKIVYTSTATGTDVTWVMDGEATGVLGKYFGLMMDRMVGPMFEQGLDNLKAAVEALPPVETTPEEGVEDTAEPPGEAA
jgi:hypothetical protein